MQEQVRRVDDVEPIGGGLVVEVRRPEDACASDSLEL